MISTLSVLSNLLRHILWASVWSILENVPCILNKYVYSPVVRWHVLSISVKSNWYTVLFKSSVSLLVICLEVLSLIERWVLKYPSVDFSTFSFNSVHFCFMYFRALLCIYDAYWIIYIYKCYLILNNWPLVSLQNVPSLVTFFVLRSIFSDTIIYAPAFLWFLFA